MAQSDYVEGLGEAFEDIDLGAVEIHLNEDFTVSFDLGSEPEPELVSGDSALDNESAEDTTTGLEDDSQEPTESTFEEQHENEQFAQDGDLQNIEGSEVL